MKEAVKCPSVAIQKGTVFEFPDGSIFRVTKDAYLIERKAIESVAVNKMLFKRAKTKNAVKEARQ